MFTFKFVEGAPNKAFEDALLLEMNKGVKFFEKELLKIRSGRAHTSMVEDIKVNNYGTFLPLKQCAALSAPDVNLLVIQPWDKSLVPEIEKAISTSDLGVTPATDGIVVRIQLPKLSSERREELARVLSKKVEEARVAVRATRKDAHNLIRDAEKNKTVSEDYAKRLQDVLQKITDKVIESVEQLAQKKETEIKQV